MFMQNQVYPKNFEEYKEILEREDFAKPKKNVGNIVSDKGLAFFIGAPILDKESYDFLTKDFEDIDTKKIQIKRDHTHVSLIEPVKSMEKYDEKITDSVLEEKAKKYCSILDSLNFEKFSLKSYELKLLGNSITLLWIPSENKEEIFRLRNNLLNKANDKNINPNKIIHTTLFYFKELDESKRNNVKEKINNINSKLKKDPIYSPIDKIGLWKDRVNIKGLEKEFDLYNNMDHNIIAEKHTYEK